MLNLLVPYLEQGQRTHLMGLVDAYNRRLKMAKWTAFPHVGDYQFDAASVQKYWARLHAGDAEPLPRTWRYWKPGSSFITANFKKRSRLA